MNDEVFLVEKDGRIVVIESPCFYDNITELESYIDTLNAKVEGVLLSYNSAGASFQSKAKKYATKHADEYGHMGGGKALIDGFIAIFKDSFDASIHTTTDYLTNGKNIIGGIEFDIINTAEGFDIFIPEIDTMYTHMLGHNCHSIVAGEAHADAIISTLKEYLSKGYDLIITSHYTPEDLRHTTMKN